MQRLRIPIPPLEVVGQFTLLTIYATFSFNKAGEEAVVHSDLQFTTSASVCCLAGTGADEATFSASGSEASKVVMDGALFYRPSQGAR